MSQEEFDYYEALGLKCTATDKEIKKAYRLLARECHPDRKKDDPKARDRFEKITKARDVLTDQVKKAKFDTKLAQKAARRRKDAELDVRTVQMKKELEEAERVFFKAKRETAAKKRGKAFHLRKITQETRSRLEEELNKERQEEQQRAAAGAIDRLNCAVCVAWRSAKRTRQGYTEQEIFETLASVGPVQSVSIVGNKKRKAVVHFAHVHDAAIAVGKNKQLGKPGNKLKLFWPPSETPSKAQPHHAVPEPSGPAQAKPLASSSVAFAYDACTKPPDTPTKAASLSSFEEEVFAQLRQAAEKQKEDTATQQVVHPEKKLRVC